MLEAGLGESPDNVWEIGFEELQASRFTAFLRALADANSSDVYVWTNGSNACGLHPPVPLLSIDFSFKIELIEGEVLVLLASDVRDRVLFDFSRSSGVERVEVGVYGPSWGRVTY